MPVSPTSSHGGGGLPLTGGTLTGPLTLDMSAGPDLPPLRIQGAAGGSADLLQVVDGGNSFALEVFQIGGHSGGVYLASTVAGNEGLYVDGSAGTAAAVAFAKGGSAIAGFDKDVHAFTNPAVPATVALVSAAGAQLSTAFDVEAVTPVTFNPGAATTATCTVAISPDDITYYTLGIETEPAGVAFDGTIHLVRAHVPRNWYLKLTVNAQAVLGTTTYF